ncbi:sigma-70 family RNA polymerase sigma factor [Diaphorobacter nitroreducens]|uniref:sigma-70 family RNA polymerase sigma factor n=1 Tax=Diaphorobacter nitroreducens TaxID=164759 RepID=UPI0028988FA3|nr:sigma-70 family RNA polymerase sigma factor [Diaphorobacter nitroreducens]
MSQFLRMAVMAGVESAVQIHIDRGDNLNACDSGGMTPLMLSAARDKPSICKMLLEAGADHGLLDPSGRTALEIAIAAGSNATAAILASMHAPPPSSLPPGIGLDVGSVQVSEALQPRACASKAATPFETEATESETPSEPSAHSPPSLPEADVKELDEAEFDLSSWEAEVEPVRPEADVGLLDSATMVQAAITAHEPIDSSADWDDIDTFLPDVALLLARSDDAEGRAKLRVLLRRALREGSVPALDVQAQTANGDCSVNSDAEAYLTMVINDLGAEVDERLGCADADESFEVFATPEETPEEETTLDEALAAIDRAASPRHEPIRIYQREFQRFRLLAAEEEVQLAKDMEAALDAALNALASWPDGIVRTLGAGAEVAAGTRPISSIWAGGEPDPEPVSSEALEASELAQDEPEEDNQEDGDPEDEAPADAHDATFAGALRRLAALGQTDDVRKDLTREIHQALADLRLSRRFLLELSDAANGPSPCPGFLRAMADFRKARDWMTASNLRLAFFEARKYLHSGEPLDDLAQEGNIGLLKAVDRYDWRRGFRFATYATWWIRQQIGRYVADKARAIRVPVHVHEKLQRTKRIAQALEAAVGREPTLEEVAKQAEMPPHKVAALLRIPPEPLTIDEASVDSMIAIDARHSCAPPTPESIVNNIQLNHAVDRYVSSLSTKDRKEEQVLRMRFGIGVDDELTLNEIGSRFGVTRERIRQIEAKAIRKLRQPVRSKPFARMVLALEHEESPLAPGATGAADEGRPDASGARRRGPKGSATPG